jgi:hypothetical protein
MVMSTAGPQKSENERSYRKCTARDTAQNAFVVEENALLILWKLALEDFICTRSVFATN